MFRNIHDLKYWYWDISVFSIGNTNYPTIHRLGMTQQWLELDADVS